MSSALPSKALSVTATPAQQQQQPNKDRKRIGLPFQAKNALVLIGTYHSILAGLVLRGSKFALKFTTKHHVGCINTVTVCDKYIATSGTDEKIFLFTCKNKGNSISDLGSLAPPAEVRCMSFPTPHFLACGCNDGSLIVYKTRDWQCAFVLHNVHGKSIEGIGFHPAGGKVAVTIGNDRFICVLDMNHGKVVTKMRVPVPIYCPRSVFFSKSGKYFFIVLPFVVLVYDALTAVLVQRLEQPEHQPSDEIHAASVVGDTLVFIGCEDGSIRCVSIDEDVAAATVKAVVEAQQPSQDAKKPSLASLDKSKKNENNNNNKSDSDDESIVDSEASSDTSESSNDEDEDNDEHTTHDNNNNNNNNNDGKKKISFAAGKKRSNFSENTTADVSRSGKLAKVENPYLSVSSISVAKAKAQNEKTAADKHRKEEHRTLYESVSVVLFPAVGINCVVPADLVESQSKVSSKQCKRKYPTGHDGRVRNLIVQPDEAQNVIISADTEGCVIAWKVEDNNNNNTNANCRELRYLASANTKSHVTTISSLIQE